MTRAEIIRHYAEGAGQRCLVCDLPLELEPTGHPGQGRCLGCGATYQAQGRPVTADCLARLGLAELHVAPLYCDAVELLPLLRDYWRERRRKLPLGADLRDSPITFEDRASFWLYAADHAGRYRGVIAAIDWDGLVAAAPCWRGRCPVAAA
jgi:hypothetical protein